LALSILKKFVKKEKDQNGRWENGPSVFFLNLITHLNLI